MKMKLWLQSPCPFFGFIVNICDDSILLIHEVVVNFFQLPERIKNTRVSQDRPKRIVFTRTSNELQGWSDSLQWIGEKNSKKKRKRSKIFNTWKRLNGLRCWETWQWHSSQRGESSFFSSSETALLTSPARETGETAPSSACCPYCWYKNPS